MCNLRGVACAVAAVRQHIDQYLRTTEGSSTSTFGSAERLRKQHNAGLDRAGHLDVLVHTSTEQRPLGLQAAATEGTAPHLCSPGVVIKDAHVAHVVHAPCHAALVQHRHDLCSDDVDDLQKKW